MRTQKILLVMALLSAGIGIQNKHVVNAASNNDTSVNNVSEAIGKLITAHNYTIEVSTKIGPIDVKYNIFYTENGFYDNFIGDEYGYVEVDDTVFSFDLYNRTFTASNPLMDEKGNKVTSLWDDYAFGFNQLRTNEFTEATGKTFTSNSKRVKTFFMDLFHISLDKYVNVEPVEFSVGNDVNSLEFVFSISTGEQYNGKVFNFGTTKIDVIDEYLNSGLSYHTNDETLNKIINLFSNYNYTRLIYDSEEEGYNKIIGQEKYNENYFYTFFDHDYLVSGAAFEIGVVGIDKEYPAREANGQTYGPYEFHGSYYCFISEDSETHQQNLDIMTSIPINTDPFVPNVYVYPTFLQIFSDTQYLEPSGGSENEYYSSKLSCIRDFITNFQLTESLSEIGAVPTGVFVKYYPTGSANHAGTENKETVIFTLELNYYGLSTTVDYVYTDFNTTSIDVITQENIDKVIENAIQSMIDRDAASNEEGGD